jgi:hypothetical protein
VLFAGLPEIICPIAYVEVSIDKEPEVVTVPVKPPEPDTEVTVPAV